MVWGKAMSSWGASSIELEGSLRQLPSNCPCSAAGRAATPGVSKELLPLLPMGTKY